MGSLRQALELEVAVFPDEVGGGVRASQMRLLTDLREELEQY